MRKLTSSTLMLMALSAAFMIGCKSKEKTKAPKGEVEVVVPCSGSDYFTTNKAFRANSIGESSDQVTSKKKALTNARNELAQAIQTTVKTVTDNYVNSREFNNKEEVEERFESLNREVVNQTLSGIRTICEKLMKTEQGSYKTYIAIELSADELVTKYNERLSKDERLRIDYDYEKFKETFEKEMEKMSNR
jgi:predicted component of type VI protein secretion system